MSITQAQLAEKVGVSQVSVSLAFKPQSKGLNQKTRARILEAAEKYGYRANAAARSMRNSQTHQIGLLLCNSSSRPFDNPSVMEMLVGMNNRLAADGYMVVLVRIGDVVSTLHQDSRVFHENTLDGMVVCGAMSDEILTRIRELVPTCLFVDSNIWESQYCIQRDEYTAGQMAAKALIQAGYQKLVWTGVPNQVNHLGNVHYSLAKRYEGVESVTREAGVELAHCDARHGVDEPQTWPDMLSKVKQTLSQPKVGVLAYNISCASQWTNAAMELGIRAGHDFGLSCCDSSYSTCLDWPGLSRTLFDRFDMGIQAAEMMIRILKHPEFQCVSRLITPHWHQGTTIGSAEGMPNK